MEVAALKMLVLSALIGKVVAISPVILQGTALKN